MTENLIAPHTLPNCQWQDCPEHNPEKDPAYTPPMQWTEPLRSALPTASFEIPPSSPKDVMSICAWCTQLKILSLQRRETDVIVILQTGSKVEVWRNNKKLFVSHGICEACQAEHFPKPQTAVAQEAKP